MRRGGRGEGSREISTTTLVIKRGKGYPCKDKTGIIKGKVGKK